MVSRTPLGGGTNIRLVERFPKSAYALLLLPRQFYGAALPCAGLYSLEETSLASYMPDILLLADRGYGSNEIIDKAAETGCEIVIPPKRNRKTQRCYDKTFHRVRLLVENAFLHLKQWRDIATRYAKMLTSFEAAAQIGCIAIWLKILTLTRVDTI